MIPEQMNPCVRFFNKVIGTPVYSKMLYAFDFRLFYIAKGNIRFEFQTGQHHLTAGDLITIPPGVPYMLISDPSQKPEYFLLNFDFDQERYDQKSRPPVAEEHFCPSEIFSEHCIPPFDHILVMHHCHQWESIFEEMDCSDWVCEQEQAMLRSALLKTVLTKIIIKQRSRDAEAAGLIQEVKQYIHQNAATALTNIRVATHFGYHPYYLNSLFLNVQNITLHKYIVSTKLEVAKKMLSLTEKPVSAIALEMGFKDGSYFSAFFKKASGMTPKEYRQLSR